MKVIVAGYSKTGTKSMTVALSQLGYNVFDYLEHYTEHGDDWKKILTKGGTTEDFKRMYENVDTVVDAPACLFWDEIHKAFPDAKIVLTLRDSEDKWFTSLKNQIEGNFSNPSIIILNLSPSYLMLNKYYRQFFPFMLGHYFSTTVFAVSKCNEMLTKMQYRRHNAHVLRNAPKDKLLVFNVKQGWKPLCDFLGVEVPNNPFPHENVEGKLTETQLRHPLFKRMAKEVKISMFLILIAATYGGYKLVRKLPSVWFEAGLKSIQIAGQRFRFWS